MEGKEGLWLDVVYALPVTVSPPNLFVCSLCHMGYWEFFIGGVGALLLDFYLFGQICHPTLAVTERVPSGSRPCLGEKAAHTTAFVCRRATVSPRASRGARRAGVQHGKEHHTHFLAEARRSPVVQHAM